MRVGQFQDLPCSLGRRSNVVDMKHQEIKYESAVDNLRLPFLKGFELLTKELVE